MDSLTSGNSNPTNNPRMNLLNGSGTNNQINTTTSNAFEASAFHAAPLPQPNPVNQSPLAGASDPKAAYIKAASKKAPEPVTPAPAPKPEPASAPAPTPPEPRPVPNAPEPKKSRTPLIIGLILLLLIAIAAAVGWWFLNQPKKEEPAKPVKEVEASSPTQLKQSTSAGEVEAGATATEKSLKLTFVVETDANSGSLTPEVELRPFGTAFTGESTHTGSAVSANGGPMTFTVTVDNLENGQYHWQARVKNGDQASEWVVYGTTGDASPSFVVEAAAQAAAAPAPTPAAPAPTPEPAPAQAPAASSSAPVSSTTSSTPPAASSGSTTASTPAAATQDQTLAATGDNAMPLTAAGTGLLALSLIGLVWARRRYASIF